MEKQPKEYGRECPQAMHPARGQYPKRIRDSHSQQQNKNTQIKIWAKLPNRHFSKEDIKVANRYMKRCLMSLVTRKMQVKTTMNYHLTPVTTAIIKKTRDNKSWQGCGEKGARCTVGGNVNWYSPSGKQ